MTDQDISISLCIYVYVYLYYKFVALPYVQQCCAILFT